MVPVTNHQNLPQQIDTVLDQLEAIRKLLKKDDPPDPIPKTLNFKSVIVFMAGQGINISPSRLYKFTSASSIPFKKFGRQLLFDRDEIQQWCRNKISVNNLQKEVITNLAATANKKIKNGI